MKNTNRNRPKFITFLGVDDIPYLPQQAVDDNEYEVMDVDESAYSDVEDNAYPVVEHIAYPDVEDILKTPYNVKSFLHTSG